MLTSTPQNTGFETPPNFERGFQHYSYSVRIPPYSSVRLKFKWNIIWYSTSVSLFVAQAKFKATSNKMWNNLNPNLTTQVLVSDIDDPFGIGTQSLIGQYYNAYGPRQIINNVIFSGSFIASITNERSDYQNALFSRGSSITITGVAANIAFDSTRAFDVFCPFSSNPNTVAKMTSDGYPSQPDYLFRDISCGVEFL